MKKKTFLVSANNVERLATKTIKAYTKEDAKKEYINLWNGGWVGVGQSSLTNFDIEQERSK